MGMNQGQMGMQGGMGMGSMGSQLQSQLAPPPMQGQMMSMQNNMQVLLLAQPAAEPACAARLDPVGGAVVDI